MEKLKKAFGKINRLTISEKSSVEKNLGKNMGIIALDKKERLEDFADDIRQKKLDDEIEYIQPDYEISLMSGDTYYSSQWGLGNGAEEKGSNESTSYRIPMEEILEMLPPHLKDAVDRSPELRELLLDTPQEEMRERLMARDVQGDIPPHILLELAHEPALMHRIDQAEIPAQYSCSANVTGAWERSEGEGVTVAVIDTGIDVNHEELADNTWVNTGEIPGNGEDDDGNGYIDDVNGWNFSGNSGMVYDGSSSDSEKHGTHIAGIISAIKDNGKGTAGVAPLAKVMSLKVFKDGTAYTSDILNAIEYAEKMGAKIVNCSWGSSEYNRALEDAIRDSGMLFVCAAGNIGADIDQIPVYPAAFDCPNIITAASVGRNGALSSFSSYGANSVDVAAPGEDIYSALPSDSYGSESGTSMAAAFVSGEAALLFALGEGMDAAGVKDRIIKTSDHLSSLAGKVQGGNKISCANAVKNTISDEVIQVEAYTDVQEDAEADESTDGFKLFSAPNVEGQFVKVAGGGRHTLALKDDGTVWACGYNYYGQLGDGTKVDRSVPVQVTGLSGVTAIAAGQYRSIALKDDGTIWTWGYNYYGQLGDGTTMDRTTPVQVNGLSDITAVAACYYHTVALKDDGTVWTWGNNENGQLGDGTTINRTTPVQVSGLSGITGVAAGSGHTIVLKNDGTVWTWGRNSYGQLGDGTTTSSRIPVQVSGLSGLSGITDVAAGSEHTIALKNDGTVWTWGYNSYGQLGDATTTNRATPAQVNGLNGITAMAEGNRHTIAVKYDGTVWTWGDNAYGQLGNGTSEKSTIPLQIIGLKGTKDIDGGDSHTIAIKEDGTVWTWGYNYYGQLGEGSNIRVRTPIQMLGLSGVTSIAGGNSHTIALKEDGTVWTCGYNSSGQLGDGTTEQRLTPVRVSGLSNVTAIAAGGYHNIALKEGGTVWTWGDNRYGQLGDGTTANRTTSEQVSGLNGIIAIAAGTYHTIGLKSDGTVWTWGHNLSGQLGDGTNIDRLTPVQVKGLNGIIAIATDELHNIALKEDGTVWTWGDNRYGQLGDGTTRNRTTPVQTSGLSKITAVAAGVYHTVALKEDGTVWTWGNNNYGQLGDGTTTYRTTPMQVNGLSDVTAVAAGSHHTIALKNDGTVWTWGLNIYGQLGDGTTTSRRIPVQVSRLSGITGIAAGDYHTAAVKEDSTVWTWGYNMQGQLGNGEAGVVTHPKWAFGTPGDPAVSITCAADKTFNLVLKAANMRSLSDRTFTVKYIADDLDITDLCSMTWAKETAAGAITGTDITIQQYLPGTITFTVNKSIPSGKQWSGIVNAIRFKCKKSMGETKITYAMN
ncbi:S8 family serine peptidase [Anaerobacterium chartisolvens]|nr:S8 family serine peptidase [Anaerobacterium chartisolvens]